MNEPRLYLLVAGTRQMAVEFCRQRKLATSEIGRTVFTTSMDESVLRGRRGPVEMVYGFDDDPRPFKSPDRAYTSQELEHMRTAGWLNRMATA